MGNKPGRKQQYENEPLPGSLENFSEQIENTWKDEDLKKKKKKSGFAKGQSARHQLWNKYFGLQD